MDGGEALCTVNLKRINRSKKQKVMISHFPKQKEPTWFLIVGNQAKNDILAMKRVTFNRFATKQLTIALPDDFQNEKLELHLVCDSYIGLDQYHTIDLVQINSLIQGKQKEVSAKDKNNQPYITHQKLQQEIVEDIQSDDEGKKEKPKAAIQQQIKHTIGNLLDDEDGDFNFAELDELEEEDDEDYDMMIEKDIDNWI